MRGWLPERLVARLVQTAVPPPNCNHRLDLFERAEDLTVEQFVTQPGFDALAVAVLSWTAGSMHAVCKNWSNINL